MAEISDRAIALLRENFAEPEERLAAVRWAEGEFSRLGLWPTDRLDEDDPENILFNLIEENLLLPDWMRARFITEQIVLGAENFWDLIARLTPRYWDDT